MKKSIHVKRWEIHEKRLLTLSTRRILTLSRRYLKRFSKAKTPQAIHYNFNIGQMYGREYRRRTGKIAI